MKETEIKVLIKDKSIAVLQLENLGCKLSEPKHQVDHVYLENSILFEDIKPGINVLRIRIENDKSYTLTLKQQISNELDRLEFEVIVSDYKALKQILRLMNYVEVVTVRKTRIETSYNSYNIVIDDVENLGYFMEVEKVSNSYSNGKIIQDHLFAFFQSLKIPYVERVFQGYDTLIYTNIS